MAKKKQIEDVEPESAVVNFIKDLVIIEPTNVERQIFKGETKVLKYQLRNSSFHVLEGIDIEAHTVLELGENKSIPTKKNYIKHIDYPKVIEGHNQKTCLITVKIPIDYNEMITKFGELIEWPPRVVLTVKSLKRIEEL